MDLRTDVIFSLGALFSARATPEKQDAHHTNGWAFEFSEISAD
jgi:hypothetical protein